MNVLIDAIVAYQINRRYRHDEPLSISFFNPNSPQGKSTTHLNGNFVHSQVSLDVLLRMKCNSTDKNELITLCKQEYKNNDEELEIIDEFERDYTSDRALWWYTRESFLYRLLNKALRIQNMDMLFLFRFFIRDLEQQLIRYQCTSRIRLYRGQSMSREELQILKNSIGQFISINSFVSTSIDREQALTFVRDQTITDQYEKILFEIDADPRLKGIKPFANITQLSYFAEEEEVLLMFGSIFQLLRLDHKDHIWILRLRLCTENENDLKATCEHMKNQYGKHNEQTDLLSFGSALTKMGRYDEAEKYFQRLLNELPSDHWGIADCYHNLGEIEMERGDYRSSLIWHKKSLDLRRKRLKPNDPDLAETYNSMGIVYRKQGDQRLALDSFEKALSIFQEAFGHNHSKVGMCWNNIGNIYNTEKKYSQALEYYLKALTIQKKDLPSDHPDLGTLHCNIGTAYQCLNQENAALEHFQLSLKILEKTLPSEHPAIATIVKNIGIIYENQGNLREAYRYFQRAAGIRRSALPRNHPDVIRIEDDLQRVTSQMK